VKKKKTAKEEEGKSHGHRKKIARKTVSPFSEENEEILYSFSWRRGQEKLSKKDKNREGSAEKSVRALPMRKIQFRARKNGEHG